MLLHRIGRRPDPLAWPPWANVGSERFDDPDGPTGKYRVLYAAEERVGAFVECLYRFRATNELIAAAARLLPSDPAYGSPPLGRVPPDWCEKRLSATLEIDLARAPLDLRQTANWELIRRQLADMLFSLGLKDLDYSDLLSPDRLVSRAIGRWAYENDYPAIIYTSRWVPNLTCWAIFEGTPIAPGPGKEFTFVDPDCTAAMERHQVRPW